MAHQVNLYDGDGDLLREVIRATGFEQQELAQVAGVSAPWLSQVINGRRKNVDGEMIERIARVLVEKLKKRPADDRFPEERVRIALGSLSRFTDAATAVVPRKIYPPGGPVPIGASHYVKREVDKKVLAALGDLPFSMMVRGPVQCGKSSLLARLENKAQEVGVETARFDPRQSVLETVAVSDQSSNLKARTAVALAEHLQLQWRLEPPQVEPDSIPRLLHWLVKSLAPTAPRPRLLILDDIASLGAQSALEWLRFVRGLHNERSVTRPQISIAVGMTHHFTPYFSHGSYWTSASSSSSSVVNWWPKIELDWLDRDEVRTLQRAITATSIADLYKHFGGQPYLTHAAITDEGFRESVRRWITSKANKDAQAIQRAEPFRRHSRSLLRSVTNPSVYDESQRVFDAFARSCSGDYELDPDARFFLRQARLINEQCKPSIELYCLLEQPTVA